MRWLIAPIACVGVALLSLLIPSAATTDPWGWIVWGREVASLSLNTDLGTVPSWKPLPVIFTTLFSFGGDSAPTIWLVFARAAGLLSLVLGFRVAQRLAGPVAGAVTAAAMLFTDGWIRGWAHGYSAPLAAAMVLGAAERHLAGKRELAFALGAAASLARPEGWPLAMLYGLLALSGRSRIRCLAAGAVLVPALWIVPDWIGSGELLHGGRVAEDTPHIRSTSPLDALGLGSLIAGPAALVLAAIGVALAWWRQERGALEIAAATGVWFLLITLMMVGGYPSSPRWFLLPATLLYVLAGVGAGLALRAAPRPALRAAVAAGIVALAIPWFTQVPRMIDVMEDTVDRAELQDELRVLARRTSDAWPRSARPAVLRGMTWNQGALAWELRHSPGALAGLPHTAKGSIKRLTHPGDSVELPTGVTVRIPKRRRLVLFEPFGSAPIRIESRRPWRLRELDSEGRWRALLLDPVGAKAAAGTRGREQAGHRLGGNP